MSDQSELDQALDDLRREARSSQPRLDDVRARVLAAAQAADEGREPEEAPAARRQRWFPLAAAAAAVAVVLAGTVVLQIERPGFQPPAASDGPVPTEAGARDLLLEAADQYDKQSHAVLVPGTYLHLVQRAKFLQPARTSPVLQGQRIESWIPHEPDRVWREQRSSFGSPEPIKPIQPPHSAATSTPEQPASSTQQLPPQGTAKSSSRSSSQSNPPPSANSLPDFGVRYRGEGSWDAPCGNFPVASPAKAVCGGPKDPTSPAYFESLPDQPEIMLAWIRSRTNSDDPAALFDTAASMLMSGLVPQNRYPTVYRALAALDGVRIYGDASPPNGWIGTAVGIDSPNGRHELILDRATGALVGDRMIAGIKRVAEGIPPGTVVGTMSLEVSVVAYLGEK